MKALAAVQQGRGLGRFLAGMCGYRASLRADPRVPRSARLDVGFAALWVLSPIDLIPEFLRVIGPLDDGVVVALAVRYAALRVPRSVLLEALLVNPATIERLLGTPNVPG